MGSNLPQRKQRDRELLRCARLRIHTFSITKVGMVLQLKGLWRVCTLGTMFLTSSRFSLLKMSAPEDHQVSHKCLPLCSTTSKRKDTSLFAFGTDSTAMLNSLLGCLQAKISDVR
jgi:hypothetical protein